MPTTVRVLPPPKLYKIRRSSGKYQWVTREELTLLDMRRYGEFNRRRRRRLWLEYRWRVMMAALAAAVLAIGVAVAVIGMRQPSEPGTAPPSAVAVQRVSATPAATSAGTAPPDPAPATLSTFEPGAPQAFDSAEIERAVAAWAAAWSGQRAGEYLDCYSERFRPPEGVSPEAWEQQRRQRLTAPAFIEVGISDLEAALIQPGRATTRFTQSYRSPTFDDRVFKRLELIQEGGRWKILSEQVEN